MNHGDAVICVQSLNKIFKIYASPKDMLKELIFGGQRHRAFRALEDVSFTIKRGEVVGVMGRNGAGKSTLLRILSGTLDATSGTVDVKGRVSAILELGSGFNSEYTGLENIFSGGLVMGLTRSEIEDRIEDIIAFSELEEFIDRPFKTYSSGMQARLTFATAISVTPEVLIVDEALSVGDASFQAKCYARIQKFRDEGGSILLVSHSDNAITHFCDRALLMERGRVIMDAPPREVTMAYCDMIWGKKDITSTQAILKAQLGGSDDIESEFDTDAARSISTPFLSCLSHDGPLSFEERLQMKRIVLQHFGLQPFVPLRHARRMGEQGKAEIIDLGITDHRGKRVRMLKTGDNYRCFMRVLIYEDMFYQFGFVFRTAAGQVIFCSITNLKESFANTPFLGKRGDVVDTVMDFTCWLANATFFLTGNFTNAIAGEEKIEDGYFDGIEFSVLQNSDITTDSMVWLNPSFSIEVQECFVTTI